MDNLYFDNAATSWPKPIEVTYAVTQYWQTGGGLGRSNSRRGDEISIVVDSLRDQLAEYLGAAAPSEISFCANATDALNLLIHGFFLNRLRQSAESLNAAKECPLVVLTSRAEHNSVLRPLHSWIDSGHVELALVECDEFGQLDPVAVSKQLTDRRYDLVCLTHASNVTGIVNELSEIGSECRKRGIPFLVDAAQTVGHVSVDVEQLRCDFLVASGHKGLMGPLGTGIFYVRQSMVDRVDSLRSGGTGTMSQTVQPDSNPPAKWEAGNPNVPGLLGLAAAVAQTVNEECSEQRLTTVSELSRQLWDGLSAVDGLSLMAASRGNPFAKERIDFATESRVPVISCVSELLDPQSMGQALMQAGIVSRSGYHCAPWIHSVLGTELGGTLRLSPGPFNTGEQVDQVVEAVREILSFS